MKIDFENRNIESGFRLIVGADGIGSKARSLVNREVWPSVCSPVWADKRRSLQQDRSTMARLTSQVRSIQAICSLRLSSGCPPQATTCLSQLSE